MHTHHERGMALVLTLFLMSVLSALAASLMFLSQTETYASMNYRMMSQARYAAESAVQKASNFLLDSTQYPIPSGGDPLLNPAVCNRQVSPVTCSGQPVILSAMSSQASNYPVTSVQTAFNTAAQGSLTADTATLTYGAYATLLAMQVFDSYGGGQAVVQTWQITADGSITGARKATVEVSAMIETPKIPASSYAAFATDNTCGALSFSGNVTIDSYDSTSITGSTAPTAASSGGNVGTNGNLNISGSVDVQGNLYTPRTGVGNCSSGAVTALTGNINHVDSIVQLPAAVSYPTPQVPAPSLLPAAGPINSAAGACALLGLTIPTNCTESGSVITINGLGTTLSLPSVTLGSGTQIILVANSPPAQYNFNSIALNGGSSVGISATGPTQAVLVDVVGKDNAGADIAMPIDFVGGTFASVTGCATCSNYDASMLQFIYAGTGEMRLTGNSGAAATFYAPNATAVISGTADLYGSLLAHRISNIGSGNLHYDRRLGHDFYVAGHPMASDFTWRRF